MISGGRFSIGWLLIAFCVSFLFLYKIIFLNFVKIFYIKLILKIAFYIKKQNKPTMQDSFNIGKINITFSKKIPKKILKKLSSFSIKSLYSNTGDPDLFPSALEVDPDTGTIIKVTNIKKDHMFAIATAKYENDEELDEILKLLITTDDGLLITKSELNNMTQEQVSDLIDNFNNLNIHKN
jgi:hypothetical protein